MNKYFAYIYTNTDSDNPTNLSINEQRQSIEAFADQQGLSIEVWIADVIPSGEVPVAFNEMVLELLMRNNTGLIIDSFDRLPRSRNSYCRFSRLIDHGIDVRVAHLEDSERNRLEQLVPRWKGVFDKAA